MRLSASARQIALPAIAALLLAALPFAAGAHTGADEHSHLGFFTGFFHPLTGMDHLAAMVSVGLWSALAARRAGPELLWGPLGFAGMLLAGAVLGLQGMQIPAVEPMIAASLLVTGLLVVTRWHVPGIAAALIVGVFAVFHGLAHGYELADAPNAWVTLAGMLSATVLLHLTGLGVGWALRSANVWVPRVAGALVAIFGVTLLAQLA
ncbi:MAG: HupE/UreJ family protein [Polaromonas sp.]|uniref:HupE/UreJ family protein n=1 Tax=Polaromonas sp. TaxID=1869339 RepID=UPI0032677951